MATDPGPLRAAVAFDWALELPESLADDRSTRLGRTTLTARVEVALHAFGEHVELNLDLDNPAADHRLRLVVATGIEADAVACDGHWHVIERPVARPPADHWYQRPVPTVHQRRFTAVDDGAHGLAVLARGLPEAEPRRGPDGVELAITLLRSVGWLSRDDLRSRPQGAGPAVATPEAQCPGRHRFELGVVPFAGGRGAVRLHRAAERFTAPARAFPAGPHDPRPDLKPERQIATDDTDASTPRWQLELTAPLTLSAVHPYGPDGALVRVWNPAPQRVRGRLALDPTPTTTHRARLDGHPLDAPPIRGGVLELDVGPSEVVTVACTFAPKGGEATD